MFDYSNEMYCDSNLLHLLKDQDLNQMKYVFNSIDIDQDGHLSLSEMKKFASEIRSVTLSYPVSVVVDYYLNYLIYVVYHVVVEGSTTVPPLL